MTINPKIEALLGFSVRARKIIIGSDNILTTRKRQYLILCDKDISENTVKKLSAQAGKLQIPLLTADTPLSEHLHKDGVKAVSLTDGNMANEIIKISKK